MPAGGSRHAGLARDRRQAAALRQAGRPGGLQVRRAQDRGDLPARAASSTASIRPTIDLFVSHQANRRIIQAAAERLGLPECKVVINLERFGNTTARDDSAGARRRRRRQAHEEGRSRAADVGRRRLHRRRRAVALVALRVSPLRGSLSGLGTRARDSGTRARRQPRQIKCSVVVATTLHLIRLRLPNVYQGAITPTEISL